MSELTIDGIDRLDGAVNRIVAEIVDDFKSHSYLPLLGQYLVDLEELHSQYFQAESDPDGRGWAPLAPATIAAKGHSEILVDTERLIESLAMQGEDAVRHVSHSGEVYHLIFGTSVEYATHHMTGTEHMPARPMVGVSSAVVDSWSEEIAANAVHSLKVRS